MKAIQFIEPGILLFFTVLGATRNYHESVNGNQIKDTTLATHTNATDTFKRGEIIPRVFCKGDATQSYALYIPAKANQQPLPVIYFFDPHGDGSFPLSKYKALADIYNFILAGSNNSKNGNDWSTTEYIWKILSADLQERLKINPDRIYTCGFSGGAKAAGQVAMNHPEVKGVIANGAGLPDGTPANNFHFTFTAIAGEGDMNMTDLVAFNAALDKTKTKHHLIFFDGKHEWAPENTMSLAFTGLQLDAMQQKLVPEDEGFIDNYTGKSKNRVAAYLQKSNYAKAESACKLSISLLDGLTGKVDWFREKDAVIKNNPVYQQQQQTQQNLLVKEDELKSLYMQQFQQGDRNYWRTTIRELQIKSKPTVSEGAMYQRLLAYLSLAFYSISNQLINGNRDKEAEYFDDLYKLVDATNSEAWYFSAILHARNHDAKATRDDLLKAIGYGFTDKNRMLQQPEFKSLGGQINLVEIGNKIGMNAASQRISHKDTKNTKKIKTKL